MDIRLKHRLTEDTRQKWKVSPGASGLPALAGPGVGR
jgi:hypothetical protein